MTVEEQLYARAWEIAEPDIATAGRLRGILTTAREGIEALPALHGPWPVEGWDAKTTIAMLSDLTPAKNAADVLHEHALEYARAERSAGP